jgi:hypothetical protein
MVNFQNVRDANYKPDLNQNLVLELPPTNKITFNSFFLPSGKESPLNFSKKVLEILQTLGEEDIDDIEDDKLRLLIDALFVDYSINEKRLFEGAIDIPKGEHERKLKEKKRIILKILNCCKVNKKEIHRLTQRGQGKKEIILPPKKEDEKTRSFRPRSATV